MWSELVCVCGVSVCSPISRLPLSSPRQEEGLRIRLHVCVCIYVMMAPNQSRRVLPATDRGNTMSVTALLWQEPIREELKLSYSNWYICAVAVPTKNCRADRVSMCVCVCVCVCVMCEAHTWLPLPLSVTDVTAPGTLPVRSLLK